MVIIVGHICRRGFPCVECRVLRDGSTVIHCDINHCNDYLHEAIRETSEKVNFIMQDPEYCAQLLVRLEYLMKLEKQRRHQATVRQLFRGEKSV